MSRAACQMTFDEALSDRDENAPRVLRGAQLVRVTEEYWERLSPEIRGTLLPYERARSIQQGLRWLAHTVEVERLLGIEVPA